MSPCCCRLTLKVCEKIGQKIRVSFVLLDLKFSMQAAVEVIETKKIKATFSLYTFYPRVAKLRGSNHRDSIFIQLVILLIQTRFLWLIGLTNSIFEIDSSGFQACFATRSKCLNFESTIGHTDNPHEMSNYVTGVIKMKRANRFYSHNTKTMFCQKIEIGWILHLFMSAHIFLFKIGLVFSREIIIIIILFSSQKFVISLMDFFPLFMSSWTVFKKRKQKYVCCNKIFTLISVQKKRVVGGTRKSF